MDADMRKKILELLAELREKFGLAMLLALGRHARLGAAGLAQHVRHLLAARPAVR